jgi:hypothetical protein
LDADRPAELNAMMTIKCSTLLLWLIVLALPAISVSAQITVEVVPPNPTTQDNMILRVDFGGCGTPASVTRVGNYFRIDAGSNLPVCTANPVDLSLGILPAGAYTYELYLLGNQSPVLSGAFAVNAVIPDTPTLSPAALAALCALLVGVGWIVIARRP